MSYFVTVTSQGQISIPAPLRRKLDLHKVRKASVDIEGEKIIITPVKDIESLMGSLKTSKRFTRKQEQNAFEDGIVDEFT